MHIISVLHFISLRRFTSTFKLTLMPWLLSFLIKAVPMSDLLHCTKTCRNWRTLHSYSLQLRVGVVEVPGSELSVRNLRDSFHPVYSPLSLSLSLLLSLALSFSSRSNLSAASRSPDLAMVHLQCTVSLSVRLKRFAGRIGCKRRAFFSLRHDRS